MDEKTVQSSGYPWTDGMPQRQHTNLLGQIVPEPDANTPIE